MSDFSIFYSWQSDTDRATNHDFIRRCLEEAVVKLKAEADIWEPERVDAGLEGVAGTPEVAAILFEKIEASAIVVGDITLTGVSKFSKKQHPNPNVSMECAYAAAVLGWDRVIRVINEQHGGRDKLPFDERNRRFPIYYKLGSAAQADLPEVKEGLVNDLVEALRVSEMAELRKVRRAIQRLDVNCLEVIGLLHHQPYFYQPARSPAGTIPIVTGMEFFDRAIPRMLDLGLLFANTGRPANAGGGFTYAYHWTYLGKKVIEKLKRDGSLPEKSVAASAV